MKVLFLCHRMPYPPDKGDKIRAFYELRAMATRHEVDVFTLVDDPQDLVHRRALEAHCNRVTTARVSPRLARFRSLPYLLTRTPLTIPYFYSTRLQAAVREAVSLRNYDRIFVYCSAMAQYVPCDYRPQGRDPIPIVIDLVDVDSDKWAQYATATTFPFSAVYRKEARDLRAYEREVCEKADCVVVATEREAELARQFAPTARVHVVSNGVDTTHFAPDTSNSKAEPPCIVFTGDMSYFPNQDGVIFFARQVLPLIRREMLHVRFVIVGRNPGRRVRELSEIQGVQVTGFVPEVRPWLQRATVAVAPLMIAAGIQNKILEAMASGLPVVATRRATQGLTKPVADLIDVGETAEDLAARLVPLLRDPLLAHRQGLEGRSRVAADYSWDRALHRLLQLIEDPHEAISDVKSATTAHDSAAYEASA